MRETPAERQTTSHTEVNRYGNVYRITSEVVTIPTSEVQLQDDIWEGAAWSSHGTKDGFWSPVDESDTVDSLTDYHGDTITVRRSISRVKVY